MRYIVTLDEGTTSVRALLFDVKLGKIIRIEKQKFKQFFPRPAYVEHDAEEIWRKIKKCLKLVSRGVSTDEIYGLGITNQRETTVAWDKKTGKPLCHAIVWQCRRTAKLCEKLKKEKGNFIHSKTGLIPDAYFSATKMKWMLENVKAVKDALKDDRLCLGTMESYLVYRLTKGKVFVSDITNASRTMLFNIHTCTWDGDLLRLFNIPLRCLPKIVSNDEVVGSTDILGKEIKIAGLIGDQESSLFGQGCFSRGMAKNTYGTGCFLLVNTGSKIVYSKKGLLSTIAYKVKGKVSYALEGSVFNAGSSVDWLVNSLKLCKDPYRLTDMAKSTQSNDGVYLVPAFTGLGTPYWDMGARGMICGLTRASDRRHIARASLECMAYMTYDVIKVMEKEIETKIKNLKVDGGASVNEFLMQFQSDILGIKLSRMELESTCMGCMFLTGLATGAYKNIEDIKKRIKVVKIYRPKGKEEEVKSNLNGWMKAVKRCLR